MHCIFKHGDKAAEGKAGISTAFKQLPWIVT